MGLSQSSVSSMWAWPLRHHCEAEMPLATRTMDLPSGEGADSNSAR